MPPLVDPDLLLVGALVLARVGTALLVVPALGGPPIPGAARLAVALAMTLLVAPPVAAGVDAAALGGPVALVAIAAREALVGLALGLLASVGLYAAEAAGRLADLSLGPPAEEPGPVARLYLWLAILFFFATGAHRVLLAALARSYQALPLARAAADTRGLAELLVGATAGLFVSALGLAAPVLVATLLVDLTLGVAGRYAPRAHLALLALPARALVAIAAVLGSVLAFGPALGEAVGAGARDAVEALRGLGRR